jgi:hypothetical protein
LQVVLEPLEGLGQLQPDLLQEMWCVCLEQTSYLDRFYSILPGPIRGAKRLVLLLPESEQDQVPGDWLDDVEQYATIVWQACAVAN